MLHLTVYSFLEAFGLEVSRQKILVSVYTQRGQRWNRGRWEMGNELKPTAPQTESYCSPLRGKAICSPGLQVNILPVTNDINHFGFYEEGGGKRGIDIARG